MTIEELTQAIRRDPDDAEAYYRRGDTYYRQGNYDKAIEDYSQAIRLDPGNAEYYHSRGMAYSQTDEMEQFITPDEAIADFEAVLRIKPYPFDGKPNFQVIWSDAQTMIDMIREARGY
jgi:tetratricopeptide (TPR) repeat protein